MNKKRIFLLVGLLILIIVGIWFLKRENKYKETEDRIGETKKIKKIGFSVDALVIERWQRDINIVKSKAEEMGFEVEVVNAYESNEKQIEQIKALVEEGVEAIMVVAHDEHALSEVIREAKKKGVIVIAYDRLIADADVDAYVSFDNIAVGILMAEALIEKVPEGNYVIIHGSPSDHNSKMFSEGYYTVLNPYIESGAIEIVGEAWADNWYEEVAYNTVRKVLDQNIRIDGIIGANDLLAEGALSALSEYGLMEDIQVVGHDADISACQRIVEGKQLMTVYKPIKNLAEGAVVLVDALLKNKDIIYEDHIYDGTYNVPFIKFEVIPVDKENMRETIIKDFFHSEEDIYRDNMKK